jgi:hypothetical protein
MGRFMTQLFGAKKEPWVEQASADRTQISDAPPDHDETDNEKTQVVEDRDRASTANERSSPRMPSGGARPMQAMAGDPAPVPHDPSWQQPRTPALPFESRTPTPAPRPEPRIEPRMDPSATLSGAGVPPAQAREVIRLGSEPLSEPGARPLIDDKLGWSTGIKPILQHDGSATRLETNVPADYRIRSRRGWIILVVLMLIGLGAGVAIAVHVEGDAPSSP